MKTVAPRTHIAEYRTPMKNPSVLAGVASEYFIVAELSRRASANCHEITIHRTQNGMIAILGRPGGCELQRCRRFSNSSDTQSVLGMLNKKGCRIAA